MLYSVELKLRLAPSPGAQQVTAYHLYSLFLRLIESADPGLSAALHDDGPGPKPFTLALLDNRAPWRQQAQVSDGATLRLRLTFLREQPFAALLDAVWRGSAGGGVPMAGGVATCESLLTSPAQSQWAAFTTFEELMESARPECRLPLAFLSPTTFRSKGKRNILFPEPSLVFGSLLARWNAFAPAALSLSDSLLSAVRLSGYRLTTHVIDFGTYQETGFTGTAAYTLPEGLPPDDVSALQALCSFAFFSGVGAKTTMGMGQARRWTDARSLPHRAGSHTEERRRGIPGHEE